MIRIIYSIVLFVGSYSILYLNSTSTGTGIASNIFTVTVCTACLVVRSNAWQEVRESVQKKWSIVWYHSFMSSLAISYFYQASWFWSPLGLQLDYMRWAVNQAAGHWLFISLTTVWISSEVAPFPTGSAATCKEITFSGCHKSWHLFNLMCWLLWKHCCQIKSTFLFFF